MAGSHPATGQRLKVSKAGTCDRQSQAFGLFLSTLLDQTLCTVHIHTVTGKTFGICNECTAVLTEFSAYGFKMIKPNSAE